MKFEYLSPITLRKEVENLLNHEVYADERLFEEHPMMFWNLVVHFRRLKIPLNFFLPQVNWKLILGSVMREGLDENCPSPQPHPDDVCCIPEQPQQTPSVIQADDDAG